MAHLNPRYPVLIGKDERSDWNVEFPDFPGCVTAGKTLEEAAAFAREALALHVHAMRSDGETVPAPSDAAALMSRRRAARHALVLVELTPLKGAAKRVNISLDEYLLAEIDTAAAAAGTDRSNFLAAAARARIEAGAGQI